MKLLIVFLLTVVFLSGCQDSVNSLENADKTMTPTYVTDKRFITDGFLKDRLALKSLILSETQDGFKRVQLEAVNIRVGVLAQAWSGITNENPYKIRYKFTWFTQDGMAVDPCHFCMVADSRSVPGHCTSSLQSISDLLSLCDCLWTSTAVFLLPY